MQSSLAYLLAPALGYLLAQTTKYSLGLRSGKGWKAMTRSGGMPSGHTATVTALVAVIFFHEGASDLFAVATAYATLFVYDALVARRSIGEQGSALLRLIEKSPFAKDPLPRVAIGHKPLEVLVGAFIGAVVGGVVALFITV